MESKALSKYPRASFRELLSLSIPLIISLFSSYFILLADRFFLSRYTLSSFEACGAAGSLYFFFQMMSLRFVSTVQAFVGESVGAKRYTDAASYTWQMLWFSFLSPFLVIPVGLIVGKAFFKGASIENEAMIYFTYMICGNLLFSIEGTLSGFFSGIGQTKRIFKVQLISQLTNIILSPILIFGALGIIPPLGIHGAAIGTLMAKGISCIILFFIFYFHKNLECYETKQATFCPEKFFACLSKAFPRAVGQGMAIFSWNLAARTLIQNGGIDLLCCSFGSTIHLALLNDGLGLAVLTTSSFLIGAKKWELFPKLFRSTALFLCLNAAVLSLPFLFYRELLVNFLCPHLTTQTEKEALLTTCSFVWFSLVCNSIFVISFMLLTALKDLWFYMIVHSLFSPLIIPAIFYFSQQSSWNPPIFWLITGLHSFLICFIYIPRVFYNLTKLRNSSPFHSKVHQPLR